MFYQLDLTALITPSCLTYVILLLQNLHSDGTKTVIALLAGLVHQWPSTSWKCRNLLEYT